MLLGRTVPLLRNRFNKSKWPKHRRALGHFSRASTEPKPAGNATRSGGRVRMLSRSAVLGGREGEKTWNFKALVQLCQTGTRPLTGRCRGRRSARRPLAAPAVTGGAATESWVDSRSPAPGTRMRACATGTHESPRSSHPPGTTAPLMRLRLRGRHPPDRELRAATGKAPVGRARRYGWRGEGVVG